MSVRPVRILFAVFLVIFLSKYSAVILAGPTSQNYELKDYGFGAGGTESASSSNYEMFGIAGEQAGTRSASDNYKAGLGLVFTMQANVPQAPALTNPGSTYDRLKLVIDDGGNATDAAFAVAITDNSWTTTKYIQNDFTTGDVLGTEDWLTYDQWGKTSGKYITGLSQNTTYTVKVKARRGNFTESGWSAEDSAQTITPSLTFGISADQITFNQLSGENSWTDSSKSTVLTTSTNAYHGYTVYGHETEPLTNSYSTQIPDYGATNGLPTSWTGLGFGYTTNDSDLIGGALDRFTNGGPKYAGFTTSAPGDPVADHRENVVENPVTGEQFTVSYRVTVNQNQTAGQYHTTLIYVVVPEY